jgi:hypothetical protein
VRWIQSTRLNGYDPFACLKDVFRHLSHYLHRQAELYVGLM